VALTESREASAENHEKCIKQFALNADRNAKSRSNQQRASLFIAGIASEKEKDSDSLVSQIIFFIFLCL